MKVLFAALCIYAVAGEPVFKFAWKPLIEVIPHGPPRADVRIVGGVAAEPHKYGYQAAIIKDNHFICGGVVITEKFVLTAAHCVDEEGAKYKALMGGHNLSGPEKSQQIIGVRKMSIHPNYTLNDVAHDIAVLELKKEIKFNSKIYAINLPETNVHSGMPLVVTGWGRTLSSVQSFSVLQKISTNVITQSECKQTYRRLDPSMFCAFMPTPPVSTCNGDSGGPAAYKKNIMGLTSFGTKDCSPKYPQGYTNVYQHKEWIEGIVKVSVPDPSFSGPLPSLYTPLVLCLACVVLVYHFL